MAPVCAFLSVVQLGPLIRRIGVFNLVATGGTTLQLAILAVLTRWADWPIPVASALAIQTAILFNFAGHSRWTWRDRPARTREHVVSRLWRYELTHGITALGNVAMTSWLAANGLPVEIANIAAIATFAVVNFLVSDRALFRAPAPSTILLHPSKNELS